MKLIVVGRDELGRHHEVALVLAVLVVDDDDHLARRRCPRAPPRSVANGLARVAHRCSRSRSFSTYLASTSTSRLTGVPGAAAPRFVRSSVSGMSETSKRVVVDARHGERDAVDRDRALLDDVAQQLGVGLDRHDAREAVLADGARRRRRRRRGPARCGRRAARRPRSAQLEVDRASPARTSAERGAAQRLVHHVGAEAVAAQADVAVRQTPLTATESPSAQLARPARDSTRQAHAVGGRVDGLGDRPEVRDEAR